MAVVGQDGRVLSVSPPDSFLAANVTASTEKPQEQHPKEKEMLPGWQGEALAAAIILTPIVAFYGLMAITESRSKN